MKNLFKNILLFTITLLALGGLMIILANTTSAPKSVGLETLVSQVEQGQVDRLVVKNNTDVEIALKDGSRAVVHKEPTDSLPTLLKN